MKYLKVYNKFQNDRRLFEEVDNPKKADFVEDDVEKFLGTLEDIAKKPEGLKQQAFGSMTYQKDVETIQIALLLLGYELPRFGVDGLYGPETASAVEKFKQDNPEDQTNTSMWSRLKKWVGSIFEEKNLEVSGDYVKIDNNFLSETTLSYPLEDFKLTWPFGPRWGRQHNGIDLAVNSGTPILSPLDGKVLVAEFKPDKCGGTIIINHEPDLQTIYCHCSEINVKRGDDVKKGQIIGKTGGGSGDKGKGNSIGPHLHFGLKKGGQHVDPQLYLDKEIGTMTGTQINPGHSHHTHETPDETEVDNTNPGSILEPIYVAMMIEKLRDKELKSTDLQRFIDIKNEGSLNFTILDLSNDQDVQTYAQICQKFINNYPPNLLGITGEMMSNSAKKAFDKHGSYIPPELALAQLLQEGGISNGSEKSRPIRTKNPFNVGNTDSGENEYHGTVESGIDGYFNLVAKRYLTGGKTADDLLQNYVNVNGLRYAGKGYENALAKIVPKANSIADQVLGTTKVQAQKG